MEIVRINSYDDSRFSQKVLRQHGCFLVEDRPYEVEIISADTAIIKGEPLEIALRLIEEFRFYAPHITRFMDGKGCVIKQFPPMPRFKIELDQIQPSQFYVDADKLSAVQDFIFSWEDIVVPVLSIGSGWIALDGHTRLFYAVTQRWDKVYAVLDSAGDYIQDFVKEARKRHVFTPKDMKALCHADYEREWNQYCDAYFSAGTG